MATDITITSSVRPTDFGALSPVTWIQNFEQNGGYWIITKGRFVLGWRLNGDEPAELQARRLLAELEQDAAKCAAVKSHLVFRADAPVTMSADNSDNEQGSGDASGADASISAAWERRVAAYARINASKVDDTQDERAEAGAWAIADACDRHIQTAVATTPRGIEIQIWTALHNSSAYLADDEQAILRQDIAYIQENEAHFEWSALPMVAALKSLRNMGEA